MILSSRSHGSVRVVRTTSKVNGKCWNLTPKPPMNPLSDRHQIWHAWLRHGCLSTRKNWGQYVKGFLLPTYAKYTPKCSLRMFTTFFWFFQSPTAETPAWILTLNTSNDAVLRKDDPFDSYKSELSYFTEFLWKFEKINIVSIGKSLNCHNSGCI